MTTAHSLPNVFLALRLSRIRFTLVAQAGGKLPPFLGSTLRGGLAMAFKRMNCTYGMRVCDGCPVQRTCQYPNLFETPLATGQQHIRRLKDIPHPFLIEPPLSHPENYKTGDSFSFDVVLIGKAITQVPYFVFAIDEMAQMGLGVNRHPFQLIRVIDGEGHSVFDPDTGQLTGSNPFFTLEEACKQKMTTPYLQVELVTPLRIRSQGSLLNKEIDIQTILRQTCRRLSALSTFHGNGALDDAEFHRLLDDLPIPDTISITVHWHDLSRYSNRQKQKLKIGGLAGHLRISNVSDECRDLLTIASHIHIGKGTVMGLGKIALSKI